MTVEELIEARKIDAYFHQQDESRDILYKEDVFDVVELAREEMIKKACEWWKNEFTYPFMTDAENEWYREKIEDFRKAMED